MKLTHIYNKVALFAVAALSLTACNDVDEEDRFIYVEPQQTSKNILIEDFTGQRCANCPTATGFIGELQAQFGEEHVIAVGIHSGPLGLNTPLYTAEGQHYFETCKWPIVGQPACVVDRRTKVEGTQGGLSSLLTPVTAALAESAPLELAAVTSYDEATRTVTIDVNAQGILDVTGKLQVWLVEDNITSQQTMPDGSMQWQYVHNHVFRAAVNGLDGEDFAIAWDEAKTITHEYVLNDAWKAEDMSVVAFVYTDKGVQQVVKTHVIPTAEDTPADE